MHGQIKWHVLSFPAFLSIAGAGMHFSDLQLFLINPGTRAAPDAAMSRGSSREFQDRKSETFPPQWTWWIVWTCCINIYLYIYILALYMITWYIQTNLTSIWYITHYTYYTSICTYIYIFIASYLSNDIHDICTRYADLQGCFYHDMCIGIFGTIYKKICLFRYIGVAPYRLS